MSGLRGAGIYEAILIFSANTDDYWDVVTLDMFDLFRFFVFVFTDLTFAAELDISLFLIYWYSLAVEA